jgi:hypothetical protein
MDATKTSFQWQNSTWVEWQANGSAPALKWVDASGNNWRVIASYNFDSTQEIYTIVVHKYVQPVGTTEWIFSSQYNITADYTKYRRLSTGELLPSIDGIPEALDALGNIVDPTGWVYNSKYFTIGIGYNPSGAIVSINYWIYLEMAEDEGLTVV